MGEENWGQRNESKGRKGNEWGGGNVSKMEVQSRIITKRESLQRREKERSRGVLGKGLIHNFLIFSFMLKLALN